MFTTNLVTGIMQPVAQGQPGPIAAVLQWLITFTAQHLILVTGWLVRTTLLASVVWSLLVWIGGEGLGQLLTGRPARSQALPAPSSSTASWLWSPTPKGEWGMRSACRGATSNGSWRASRASSSRS
jgi:hypothetical protein